MDEINMRILSLLEENGRITHEEIAKRLHLSRPAIHDRVHKLERDGFIRGYRAVVDWTKLGQTVKAFVYIKTQGVDCQNTAVKLSSMKIDNIVIEECHRLAGPWCYSLKIRSQAPKDITKFIDTAREIPGIIETNTIFVLTTVSENGVLEEHYE